MTNFSSELRHIETEVLRYMFAAYEREASRLLNGGKPKEINRVQQILESMKVEINSRGLSTQSNKGHS